MIWFWDNHKRFRHELEALELLAASENWVTPVGWRIDNDLRMIWDADLVTGAGIRPVSMRYPNHFPHSPPVVLPRGDTTRWSQHQYGPGGELCLEFGPDNWHQEITGADMIRSAYGLLHGEHPAPDVSAEVASRHKTSLGLDLRGTYTRFLVTRALQSQLANLHEPRVITAQAACIYRAGSAVHVIASMPTQDGNEWKEQLPSVADLGFERTVALIIWPPGEPLPSIENSTEFRASVARHNLLLPDLNHLLLVKGAETHGYYLTADDTPVLKLPTIAPQEFVPRLHESYVALATRKVAIVGCDSLGCKIAASLSRCGVGLDSLAIYRCVGMYDCTGCSVTSS